MVAVVQAVAHYPLDIMEWELDGSRLQQQEYDDGGDHGVDVHDDAVEYEWHRPLHQH